MRNHSVARASPVDTPVARLIRSYVEIPLLCATAGSSDGAVDTSPGCYDDKLEAVILCDALPELSFTAIN